MRPSGGPAAVTLKGVTKAFGSLLAVEDVSLEVGPGEVLALLGENGAGKTTLMNILAGVYLPDEGEIAVFGQRLTPGSTRDSVELGIGMLHQHLKLVETLTAADNISLALDKGKFFQPKKPRQEITDLAAELDFELDLQSRVWQLNLAQRQQLEILRVLGSGARVLILDEPTAVLSPPDAERLFEIVRRIAGSGRSVILISHKLDEVLRVADSIAVLRRGRLVHVGTAKDATVQTLAELMVGERKDTDASRPQTSPGEPLLTVSDLTVNDDLGHPAVRSVSFEVMAGELVAVVGVAGNGQEELMEAIGGLRQPVEGSVVCSDAGRSRPFAHIPAERLGVGLSPSLDARDNGMLGYQRRAPFGRWIRDRDVSRHLTKVIERFGVSLRPEAPIRNLSGGNLQRVVLGRELMDDHPLLIASYPTRGLDVAAAAQIRAALVERVDQGAGVLLASEELDESLAIATRLLIMYRGEVVAERDPRSVEVAEIARFMTTGSGT